MTVRFYIDADLLGVAKILAGVRSDVTYPGDPGGGAPMASSDHRVPCKRATRTSTGCLRLPKPAGSS